MWVVFSVVATTAFNIFALLTDGNQPEAAARNAVRVTSGGQLCR